MSILHFQCPSCQAPLRLQNRALFVGRTFDCPDCHVSLLIEADGSAGVRAKLLPRPHKPTRSVSEGLAETGRDGHSRSHHTSALSASGFGVALQSLTSVRDWLSRRPAVLGWIVASLFAAITLVIVNSGGKQEHSDPVPPNLTAIPSEENSSNSKSKTPNADERLPITVAEHEPTLPPANTTDPVPKLDLPPLPEPALCPEPPLGNQPTVETPRITEKPAVEDRKPEAPSNPAVLSPAEVETKLLQKLVRFDQSKPIPFIKILDTIEELAGVPIVWDLDRVDDEQLQKLVTLQLTQTTVGEILDTLLKQVSLDRRTVDGKIELQPSSQKE